MAYCTSLNSLWHDADSDALPEGTHAGAYVVRPLPLDALHLV